MPTVDDAIIDAIKDGEFTAKETRNLLRRTAKLLDEHPGQ
jgi:hypothetical protein